MLANCSVGDSLHCTEIFRKKSQHLDFCQNLKFQISFFFLVESKFFSKVTHFLKKSKFQKMFLMVANGSVGDSLHCIERFRKKSQHLDFCQNLKCQISFFFLVESNFFSKVTNFLKKSKFQKMFSMVANGLVRDSMHCVKSF